MKWGVEMERDPFQFPNQQLGTHASLCQFMYSTLIDGNKRRITVAGLI